MRAIAIAILTGILVSVVHSIWDFVWFIPACMTLALVQVACLCRLSQLCRASQTVADRSAIGASDRGAIHDNNFSSADQEPMHLAVPPAKNSRSEKKIEVCFPWVIAASIAALGSFQMVKSLVPAARAAPYWERYESLVFTIQEQGNPDDSQESILKAIPDLEKACELDPSNARFHLKLAALYLHQFEVDQQTAPNPMTLDQIRQTVVDSQFATTEQQNQWLAAAVGDNQALWRKAQLFAQRAALLSPFQGEAYVHLSRLAFLHETGWSTSNSLLAQALRVRPHDGGVLIAAASNAALEEDLTRAMNYFRQAFQCGARHQVRVISMLAANLPPSYFLSQFEPDLIGLRHLFNFYRRTDRREQAETVAQSYLRQLESTAASESRETAAKIWFEAHGVFDYLDDKSAALTCLQYAVKLKPNDFGLRKTYAIKLSRFGSSEVAIEQLRWCLRRKPNDPDLQRIMKDANRKKLRESDVVQETKDGEISRR